MVSSVAGLSLALSLSLTHTHTHTHTLTLSPSLPLSLSLSADEGRGCVTGGDGVIGGGATGVRGMLGLRCLQVGRPGLFAQEYGTYQTIKARSRSCLPGKTP